MVDVGNTCDLVSGKWKECPTEEALLTLGLFIQERQQIVSQQSGLDLDLDKKSNEDEQGQGGNGPGDGGSTGAGVAIQGSGRRSVIGGDVIEQLKLVQGALADQVGGKGSACYKRVEKKLQEKQQQWDHNNNNNTANGSKKSKAEGGAAGGAASGSESSVSSEEGEVKVEETFELDSHTKTMDELLQDAPLL